VEAVEEVPGTPGATYFASSSSPAKTLKVTT
jgi:hypothetical protein